MEGKHIWYYRQSHNTVRVETDEEGTISILIPNACLVVEPLSRGDCYCAVEQGDKRVYVYCHTSYLVDSMNYVGMEYTVMEAKDV